MDASQANDFFEEIVCQVVKISSLLKNKFGVYPVSEKSWIDIGQWREYNSAISEFEKSSGGMPNLR